MSESTYRSSGDEEPAREARVEALRPATRELLRQECEQAVASAQPRWVGRPTRWLVAAAVTTGGLVVPLVRAFGRIDEHPFGQQRLPLLSLAAACVVVPLLVAFALRSFLLRQDGLMSGVYLFASSLIEIRDGWVRVWPLPDPSMIGRESGRVVVDLGDDRSVTLPVRASLPEATLDGSEEGVRLTQRDPLYLERGRGEPWQPLPEPAPLPEVEDRTEALARFAGLSTALAIVLSLGATLGLGRWSDSLGIARAVQQRDTRALASYVKQQGPLAEQADDAWFDLLDQAPTAQNLVVYMVVMSPRHRDEVQRRLFAQFPTEADDAVARHLLLQAAQGSWEEKRPSRVVLPPPQEGEAHLYDGSRSHLELVLPTLENYLRDGRPEQPLRPRIEERLFELRLVQARVPVCPVSQRSDDKLSSSHPGEDLLAPYIDQGGERAEEARAARWDQQLTLATTCRSLGDLAKARTLISTPAQQATFEATWRAFFAQRRTETTLDQRTIRFGHLTASEFTLPSPLAEPLDALWAYLGAHPETQVRAPRSVRGVRRFLDAGNDDGAWGGVLRMSQETRKFLEQESTLPDFLDCLMSPTFDEWDTRPDGPHIELRTLDADGARRVAVEFTLVLPGSAPRTTRLWFTPDRGQVSDFRRRLWPCKREPG